MAYELPPLPYDYNALEPHIDARTMEIHHTKHHQAYITKVNAALEGTGLEGKSIEEMSSKGGGHTSVQFRPSSCGMPWVASKAFVSTVSRENDGDMFSHHFINGVHQQGRRVTERFIKVGDYCRQQVRDD